MSPHARALLSAFAFLLCLVRMIATDAKSGLGWFVLFLFLIWS